MHGTDHARMELISTDESFALLQSRPVGRVAFVADGALQIFPVTYVVSDQRIAFQSSIGSKLDAAEMARAVAFEVDSWDEEARTGWSIVVRGPIHPVTDPNRLAALERLDHQPWLTDGEMQWVEITVADISGRRLPH